MSLTIDDQKWIKLLFDREEQFIKDTYDYHAKIITDTVREMLNEQTAKIEARFTAIDQRLDGIECSLDDKDKRLIFLERYIALPNTILRHTIAIIIGVAIGWGIHSLI